MRLPDADVILDSLKPPLVPVVSDSWLEGRVTEIMPSLLRAYLPGVGLGELCQISDYGLAEVVGIRSDEALLAPYQDLTSLKVGEFIRVAGEPVRIGVGPELLGRVVNALGQPIDGLPEMKVSDYANLEEESPDPLKRRLIQEIMPTGVRAIDAALTVGVGQRIGIFAPAGCGKSTLLGMLCAGCEADIVVIALIGERGREVREFIEQKLDPSARAHTVFVVSTSDRPALERVKAAVSATAIAEFFRRQGKRVLLLIDSLTRYARAIREIALAAGEPVLAAGYPPSLYARLPRLLERAGAAENGSITAFYTVLMEDKHDPLVEEVRSILDGHIILSRDLADANHFPAIDVLASISRTMPQVAGSEHIQNASRLRKLLHTWREIELLIRVGEYQEGQDSEADDAVKRRPAILQLLCQNAASNEPFEETLSALQAAVNG